MESEKNYLILVTDCVLTLEVLIKKYMYKERNKELDPISKIKTGKQGQITHCWKVLDNPHNSTNCLITNIPAPQGCTYNITFLSSIMDVIITKTDRAAQIVL